MEDLFIMYAWPGAHIEGKVCIPLLARWVRKKVKQMKRTILFPVLALMTGVIFIGGVWAQGTISLDVFQGKIMKVEPEGKGIVVQNQDGKMSFQLSSETKISILSFEGKEILDPATLKEGMLVTVFYKKAISDRVAERIDVGTVSNESEGFETPFTCGPRVC